MFELSGMNYEEVLEQGDSILVRVIASSSYRRFELSGLYCICYCFKPILNSKRIFKVTNKSFTFFINISFLST